MGDEIAFVFGFPLNRSRGYDEAEIRLAKKMMTYWANFAKTGNPSLSADHTWTETYWPLHTPLKRETLHLNARNNSIMEGIRVKQCAFWRKFLPQLALPSPPASPTGCPQECCVTNSSSSPSLLAVLTLSLALSISRQ